MCRKEKQGRAAAIAIAAAMLAALFAACEGPAGPQGPAGPEGPAGEQGTAGVDFPVNGKWKVTFDLDGGEWIGGDVADSFVIDGGILPAPGKNPVKSSGISDISGLSGLVQMVGDEAALGFFGWAKENGILWNFSVDTVTGPVTLKATWGDDPQIIYGAESVSSAISHIRSNPGKYVLAATPGLFTNGNALMLSNGSELTIICDDDSETLGISTSVKSPVFVVSGAGTKLTLKGNIALCGRFDINNGIMENDFPQVRVEAGAKFVMDDLELPDPDNPGYYLAPPLCVTIDGNYNESCAAWNSYGASAVFVTGAGSEFTMNGGEITNNNSSFTNSSNGLDTNSAVTANAAVGLAAGGSFIMNGGFIQNNEGTQGAVVLAGLANNSAPSGSTFTMNGGEIANNTNNAVDHSDGVCDEKSQWAGNGAAVNIQNGTFTMNGGEISSNYACESAYIHGLINAGGVYINGNSNAAFIMSGGCIALSGGRSDIYVSHGNAAGAGSRGSLTLSGEIVVEEITLCAAVDGVNNTYEADATFIKLAGPIIESTLLGPSISNINLQANNPAANNVSSIWQNRVVFQAADGYQAITQSDLGFFKLGLYCGDVSGGGFNNNPIPPGHSLTGAGTDKVTLRQ